MKRLLFVLAILALVLVLGCAAAVAEETYRCGDFEYALLPSGDAELIRYLGPDGPVTIPNDLDGHPLTAVRRNPFYYFVSGTENGIKDCAVTVAADHPYLATINGVLFGMSDRKLIYCPTSVTGVYSIRPGIRQIGEMAFYNCAGLTGVTIPDSVTEIGRWAFAYCPGLTGVTIPDSVTEIGEWAFAYCRGLTSLSIPDSVTVIPNHAFRGSTSLPTMTIPAGVTAIGMRAFCDCTGLTDVVIPDGVTAIGERAFCNCTGLTAVTLPAAVTDIGEHAFDAEVFTTDVDWEYKPLPAVFTVTPGSYAETWCAENGLQYVTAGVNGGDRDDWLN